MAAKPAFNLFSIGFGVLGLVCLDAGAAWIFHPLGFIVAGAELLALSILSLKGKK